MKKKYFTPELEVVKITTVGMLAESMPVYNGEPQNNEGDPENSLSRTFSFGGDDE